ncbi:hypothetical protein C3V36_03720 [Lachnospiraceae bacterium oral taxon 500]|nr:hypothetical protein C3V36_03720 [Lachnospiraceae bacterium oral taxon 500]
MFDRTVFFRLVAWAGTECDLRRKSREWVHADRPPGQKRKAFRSGHPLSERDRAKKDYGRLPARAESEAFDQGKVELVKSITITLIQRLGKCADNIQDLNI